jgi:hypothetical protein
MKRMASVFVLGAIATFTTAALTTRGSGGPGNDGVTVHEWGTFTSVAGVDGRAVEWLPLGGPTDLPCFVRQFGSGLTKIAPGYDRNQLDYQSARSVLWGKVRMETPVLYFYSARNASLNVRVQFPRGIITEFYPTPTTVQPSVTATALRGVGYVGFAEWRNVQVSPGAPLHFPISNGESHYFAARATDATPLRVGDETEKFLFYRGVASFDVPIATAAYDDGAVQVRNIGANGALPNVVLFENHGGRIGYRVAGALIDSARIQAPILDGSLPALRTDLAAMLVKAGLNEKEAAAMVETWRDSWFEEGTRVFYILPARAVDAILPLSISPAPAGITRVFVGRMDVITPRALGIVEGALTANDTTTLLRYARFLGPITDRILAKGADAMATARIHQVTDAVFARYVNRAKVCR